MGILTKDSKTITNNKKFHLKKIEKPVLTPIYQLRNTNKTFIQIKNKIQFYKTIIGTLNNYHNHLISN